MGSSERVKGAPLRTAEPTPYSRVPMHQAHAVIRRVNRYFSRT